MNVVDGFNLTGAGHDDGDIPAVDLAWLPAPIIGCSGRSLFI